MCRPLNPYKPGMAIKMTVWLREEDCCECWFGFVDRMQREVQWQLVNRN